MEIFVSQNKRMRELEKENIRLKGENARLRADADYIAMMTDVELEQEEDDEPEI